MQVMGCDDRESEKGRRWSQSSCPLILITSAGVAGSGEGREEERWGSILWNTRYQRNNATPEREEREKKLASGRPTDQTLKSLVGSTPLHRHTYWSACQNEEQNTGMTSSMSMRRESESFDDMLILSCMQHRHCNSINTLVTFGTHAVLCYLSTQQKKKKSQRQPLLQVCLIFAYADRLVKSHVSWQPRCTKETDVTFVCTMYL